MGGLDAVVFTAGIGENASYIRSGACRDLEFMGIDIDDAKNTAPSNQPREIQKDGAKVKVFVIPTNEELVSLFPPVVEHVRRIGRIR